MAFVEFIGFIALYLNKPNERKKLYKPYKLGLYLCFFQQRVAVGDLAVRDGEKVLPF